MGFLRTKPISPQVPQKKSTSKVLSCETCGLYKNCESPQMEPYGGFEKEIMCIGEMPSFTDDKQNMHWQGRDGRYLEHIFSELGVDLFEDCIHINAVNCYTENPKSPTIAEINSCRRIVFAAIEKYKPKIIILFGKTALMSVIGHRWKKDLGEVSKWRGFTIPDRDLNAWVCPTLDPLFVMDVNPKTKADNIVFKNDLKKFFGLIGKELPTYVEPNIEVITDLTLLNYQIINGTKAKVQPRYMVFDFETTGLKPHAPGHRIVCASVAYDENNAYVFMMPQTKFERKIFTDLLTNAQIGKIAANMKFEHTWSEVRLKTTVNNWVWDTMLAAHQLDNRSGITGLKFQTFVTFGVSDYSSEIEPYLQGTEPKNANSLNRILELIEMPGGKEKLLKYCGLDAIYEYRLAMLQMPLLKNIDL
jgi:uracil-DNA glycosylase family 4